MTSKQFDGIAEMLADVAPDLWKKAYPRFYGEVHADYLSPKIPAVILAGSVYQFACGTRPGQDASLDAALFVFGLASQKGMPVYYVAKEFLQAVMMSDLPAGLRLSDIKFPMPGAMFMLPKGVFTHPEEGNVGFISYGFHVKGQFVDPTLGLVSVCTNDTLVCVTSTHEMSIPPIFHSSVTSSKDIDLNLESLNAEMSNYEFEYQIYRGDQESFKAPSDRPFNNLVANLCLRLLVAMTARPEVIEYGANTGKRLKHGQQIWTPNFIGRTYRLRREGSAQGGGWHTRMHWRRGHYRMQPYGPHNSLRKMIWLEPCLISAERGELNEEDG